MGARGPQAAVAGSNGSSSRAVGPDDLSAATMLTGARRRSRPRLEREIDMAGAGGAAADRQLLARSANGQPLPPVRLAAMETIRKTQPHRVAGTGPLRPPTLITPISAAPHGRSRLLDWCVRQPSRPALAFRSRARPGPGPILRRSVAVGNPAAKTTMATVKGY